MKRIPKITARWVSSVFGVIVIILAGFEMTLGAVILSYYHNSVETYLINRVENLAGYYNKNTSVQISSIETGYKRIAEEFSADADITEIQVITTDGTCIYTSVGYAVGHGTLETSDFISASQTGETGVYTGKNESTGEKIMSASAPLVDADGNIIGVLRLVTSLEAVDGRAWVLIFTTIAICLGIILFVFTTNYYFINTIVSPLNLIAQTANKIAEGDMSARIENKYNDEVGELCNSINNMASELAETDKVKNDFISSVSHELRTPLTAIKGWSETMLMCDPKTDKQTIQRGLTVVSDEVTRLSHMVEELLDFSRLQSGRMRILMENVDLYAEVSQVTMIMREHAAREGIDIKFDFPDDATAIVTGDADRINQVFINIIDNAVKHSEKGSTVTIYITETASTVTVYVEDCGEGISEEDLPHVKEKFYKGLSSKRGTGLGLAVADEIVRLHGGSLDIESTLGVGTKVAITLPKSNAEKKETVNE